MPKSKDEISRMTKQRIQTETAAEPPVADVPRTIMRWGGATAGAGVGAAALTAAMAPVVGPFSPLFAPVGAAGGGLLGFGVGSGASKVRDWFRTRAHKKLQLENLKTREANIKLEKFAGEIQAYVERIEASVNFIFAQTQGIDDNPSLVPNFIIAKETFMKQGGWSKAEKELQHLIFVTQYKELKGEVLDSEGLAEQFDKLLAKVIDEKAINAQKAASYPSSARGHTPTQILALDPIDQIQYLSTYKTPKYIKDLTVRYVNENLKPDPEMIILLEKMQQHQLEITITEQRQQQKLLETQINKHEKQIDTLLITLNELLEQHSKLNMGMLDTCKNLKDIGQQVGTLAKTQATHIAEAAKHMKESKPVISRQKALVQVEKRLEKVQEKINLQSTAVQEKQAELADVKNSLASSLKLFKR